jgi:hypothetical protein
VNTKQSGATRSLLRPGYRVTLRVVHNEELYGSLVTTLRIKNIVPPSSEPRPQQQPQQEQRLQ